MNYNVKPILMSAPMVLATLREIKAPGTGKTQTRRIIKQQPATRICNVLDIKPPEQNEDGEWGQWETTWSNWTLESRGEPLDEIWHPMRCPYGKPGDLLYVRETWSGEYWLSDTKPSDRLLMQNGRRLVSLIPETWYWADGSPSSGDWEKPRPGIHMPRWASRLTLEITDIRVERLQSISEEDAIAEGVLRDTDGWRDYIMPCTQCCATAYDSYKTLWTSINGPESWTANPWVWAVSSRPHLINVDDFIKARAA